MNKVLDDGHIVIYMHDGYNLNELHFPMNMLIKNSELLNERECQYAIHPATHIDFLIYNRINKKPVLAVEVGGYEYHKEDVEQVSRDLLKDHILNLYEIPFTAL